MNKKTGESGLRNVRDVFKRRDWNTIVDEDGKADFGIEEALATQIDSPAADALADLRAGKFPLESDAELNVLRFMAAQLVRGREVRENLSRMITQVQQQTVKIVAQNYTDDHWRRLLGHVPTEDEIQILADDERPIEIKPTTAMLLDTLFSAVDDCAELLASRRWTLVSFDEPYLFSGEHPVIHIVGATGGYGVATAERFHFPISTRRSLVLSLPWTDWPEKAVQGTQELAKRLN